MTDLDGVKLSKEHREAILDRDWWQQAGDVLGLKLFGFTYRAVGAFRDPADHDATVNLTGKVAERLIATADRLTALERERDEARTLNNKYAWERDKAREERDAAERRSEAFWKPQFTASQAEVERLKEALKPFARIADMEERAEPESSVIVNVSRCRDARAALQPQVGK